MDEPDLARDLLRQRDLLFGFILALTRDHDAAEEVFQEVSLAVLNEARKGFRPDDFMAWARGLARHRVSDYYRGRARTEALEEGFAEYMDAVNQAFGEHEGGADENQERLKYLRECLARLRGRTREIVEARYGRHLSLRDVAAAVAWKEAAVKVALCKARKVLAECVGRKSRAARTEMA